MPRMFEPDEEGIEIHPGFNVDYPDLYIVTTHGRLYSLRSRRFLTLGVARWNQRPYWGWHIRRLDGGRNMLGAARVVMSSFEGAIRSSGWVPAYRDDDPTNLHLENLYWITQAESRFPDLVDRHAFYAGIGIRGNQSPARSGGRS